jgi:hypothetical protein
MGSSTRRRGAKEETTMSYPEDKMRTIYTITRWGENDKQARWTRVGVGFVNKDGSITIKLDGLPVNGELMVRDFQRREEQRRKPEEDPFEAPTGLYGARGRGEAQSAEAQ